MINVVVDKSMSSPQKHSCHPSSLRQFGSRLPLGKEREVTANYGWHTNLTFQKYHLYTFLM